MTAEWVQMASRVALVVLGIATLIPLWRLFRGPSSADRIVALDVIGLQAIGMILVHAISIGNEYLIDVAIIVVVLLFLGTVVMAHYVLRR
jgi:multisubunit Na+/H+ antiporter MnhF subunit